MANEKLDVRFPASVSKADNCICTACHGIGSVIKLELPETLYFNKNGLSTEYSKYCLCNDCRKKLVNSLVWGDIDGK